MIKILIIYKKYKKVEITPYKRKFRILEIYLSIWDLISMAILNSL
jgi:hypothetical protein